MGIPLNMRTTVLWYTAAAGGVGVPGAFAAHADLPVLVGIWTGMFFHLSAKSGKKLDWGKAGRLATAVATAAGTASAGVKIANTYFAYTGVGTPFAIAANAGANAGATYLIGITAADLIVKNKLTTYDLLCAIAAGLGLTLGQSEITKISQDGPKLD